MDRSSFGLLIIPFLFAAQSCSAETAKATLVEIDTPRGAKQAFILIKPEKAPEASVILFAGGHGRLQLRSATSMAWGAGNFLVRTRKKFAKEGFTVAVMDAPSDRNKGMSAIFRMGRKHAGDVGAVATYLKKEADVPVWLVGTSMGTFSVAGAAIHVAGADGLVLTSTVTRSRKKWRIASSHPHGVASMPLIRVKVPTFILSHAQDGCHITPASGAQILQRRLSGSRKVEVNLLTGGSAPRLGPCKAKSAHGFLGIEQQAVGAIARFIKAYGK